MAYSNDFNQNNSNYQYDINKQPVKKNLDFGDIKPNSEITDSKCNQLFVNTQQQYKLNPNLQNFISKIKTECIRFNILLEIPCDQSQSHQDKLDGLIISFTLNEKQFIHLYCEDGKELNSLYVYIYRYYISQGKLLTSKLFEEYNLYITYLEYKGRTNKNGQQILEESIGVDAGGLTKTFIHNIIEKFKVLLFKKNEDGTGVDKYKLIPNINEIRILMEEIFSELLNTPIDINIFINQLYIIAGGIISYAIYNKLNVGLDLSYLLFYMLIYSNDSKGIILSNPDVERLIYINYLDNIDEYKKNIEQQFEFGDLSDLVGYELNGTEISEGVTIEILIKNIREYYTKQIYNVQYYKSFIFGFIFTPLHI